MAIAASPTVKAKISLSPPPSIVCQRYDRVKGLIPPLVVLEATDVATSLTVAEGAGAASPSLPGYFGEEMPSFLLSSFTASPGLLGYSGEEMPSFLLSSSTASPGLLGYSGEEMHSFLLSSGLSSATDSVGLSTASGRGCITTGR